MNGIQFLQALLDARKLKPNSMAEKAGNHSLQSTVARWLAGAHSRPSTMQPIADFFGVDIGGFYDSSKAVAELRRLGISADAPATAPGAKVAAMTLAEALEHLAKALNNLPDASRDTAAERLQILAKAPDSRKALDAVRDLFGLATAANPYRAVPAPRADTPSAVPTAPKPASSRKKTEKV